MLRSLALCLCSCALIPGASMPSAQNASKPMDESNQENEESSARRTILLERYFGICDLDDSGWISSREASATLGITKARFRSLDTNKDGRFSPEEFGMQSADVLKLLGAFPEGLPPREQGNAAKTLTIETQKIPAKSANHPFANMLADPRATPKAQASTQSLDGFQTDLLGPRSTQPSLPTSTPAKRARAMAIPYPSPGELLALFDQDKSGGLSRREVKSALARVGAKLSADVIVDRTDRNRNGELGPIELGPLSFIISKRLPTEGFLGRIPLGSTAASRRNLEQRNAKLAQPQNGLTDAEQFSHFKRLDTNGDGKIDSTDLRQKLNQSHSSVRASAIISALDTDGNGSIDPEEFKLALRGRN